MQFILPYLPYVALAVVGVFVLSFVKVALSLRRIVQTNEVHIVQYGSKRVSYGADGKEGNTYYEWPSWMPIIGVTKTVLPVSNFDLDLLAYEAYDQGRLPFVVDVKAFFRIKDSNVAAQRVASFDELLNQLRAIVQGAVRVILASNDIEQIMAGRSKFGDDFTKEVNGQLGEWGCETVKNIELMDIRDGKDSQVIHNIMAKKKSHIEMESRTEVAKNKKAAEIAEIEAKREVELQKQSANQSVGLRTVEAEREVALRNQEKEQALMEQAKTTKEKEMAVTKVEALRKAEIDREVRVVKAQQEKEAALIDAEAARQRAVIEAEAQRTRQVTVAQGQKETAVLAAQGQKETALLTAEAQRESLILQAEGNLERQKREAEGNLSLKKSEAEGIALEGTARAEAEKALQLAPVQAQITLAKEIGQNQSYQQYLITIRKVEAEQAVGVEQAKALHQAQVKVIANAGTPAAGLKSAMDLFSSSGGQAVGAMLEGLAQTDEGTKLLNTVTTAAGKVSNGLNGKH